MIKAVILRGSEYLKTLIEFAMYNFTLTFFMMGGLVSAFQIWRTQAQIRTLDFIYNTIFKWFLFFSVGVTYFYNFIVHVFFGELSAHFIGWADSPFQLEVGFASLGFAAVGFFSYKEAWKIRLVAILGPGLFMLGAAGGHIYQMITANNFAPGNAGLMFYSDLFLPLFGAVMLKLTRPT